MSFNTLLISGLQLSGGLWSRNCSRNIRRKQHRQIAAGGVQKNPGRRLPEA